MRKYILFVFVFAFILLGHSQEGVLKKANKDYGNLAYIKTTEILLEVAEKGHKSIDLFQKLGNSFYFNNKMEDASKWYGELMALEEAIDSIILDMLRL